MNSTTPAFLIAALSGALAISGCAPLPPGESGPFTNGNAGAAAGAINQAASGMSGEALATGASVNVAALATVHIIAKHEASVRQRQLAQERARAATRKLGATAHSPGRPGQRPRYLAVETAKDARTAPGAAKAIMIWDTAAQEIVGNNVYDISEAPTAGARVKFETYSAEYVGVGL
jgi:hypothetical protein